MTTQLLTIDWNRKKKINNKTVLFCVCLAGTNCSLNGMEVQLCLIGTLFLHLRVAMELQSSAQEDNLRPSPETSAKANLFLRPVFLYRTWISWFSANLIAVPRDNSSPSSQNQFSTPSVHTTSVSGDRKRGLLHKSWLLPSSQNKGLLLLSAQRTAR